MVLVRGRERYWPARNISEADDQFVIAPEDYAAAADAGEVVAVFHSHDGLPEPSGADRSACEASGVPWYILGLPSGLWAEIRPGAPILSPLLGREFVFGRQDCYSLIRDWYLAERGVVLPDFARTWDWWLRGENLYEAHYATAGFVECRHDDLREGDVLLMQIGRSAVPNHAGVWMSDDTVVHHLPKRLSSRDPMDGYLRAAIRRCLRYVGPGAA